MSNMKNNNSLNGIEAVAAVGILLTIIWAASAFATMLGFGILHAHLSTAIPPIGWSDSFWTALGVWLIFGGRSAGATFKAGSGQ